MGSGKVKDRDKTLECTKQTCRNRARVKIRGRTRKRKKRLTIRAI